MKRSTSLLAFVVLLGACSGVELASDSGANSEEPGTQPQAIASADAFPILGPHKELVEIDGWLQSDVTSLEDLKGRVVVVWFWTFGCYNCKNTLPNLRELYAKYQGEDFEIVGIHAPEFDYEADIDNIKEAAAELEVTWPIVLDTGKRTFHAWQGPRAYWPRTYVLDRDGNIRFDQIGEGKYEQLNEVVATLLG